MIISGIYMIQSISKPERIYIGSAIAINHRQSQHLSNLRKNKHHSIKLQRHFNKYGEGDLQFSVLAICNIKDLKPIDGIIWLEQFFIDIYNPWFNIARVAGSTLGYKFTEDQCKRNSRGHMGHKAWNKDIPHTEEHKQQLKEAWKKRGPVPEENYRKMLEAHSNVNHFLQGHIPWNKDKVGVYSLLINKKPILQYNKSMGFIREWDSATDVVKEFPIINKKNISACLKNKRPTAGGFIWKYKLIEKAA